MLNQSIDSESPVVGTCPRDGAEILLLNDGDGFYLRCSCCSVVDVPSKEQILKFIGD